MEQLINPEQLITHYDLKILIPIFDEYTFNNRFQIRKFVGTNKEFINNLDIIYRMATMDILIGVVGDKDYSILREHFDKFEESWKKFQNENRDFYNDSTNTIERFIKIYSTVFDNRKKQEKKVQEQEKQEQEKLEKEKREQELENKEEDSNEFSFKVKVGRNEYILIRDSVKDNKYAFYTSNKLQMLFFLGGPSLEQGDYVVLNTSEGTYSKISETPGSNVYNLLTRKLKDSSDPIDLYKNSYKFMTDTYMKFQNKEPHEIKESLLEEINNLD